MVIAQFIEKYIQKNIQRSFSILATDVSASVLDIAKQTVYGEANIALGAPTEEGEAARDAISFLEGKPMLHDQSVGSRRSVSRASDSTAGVMFAGTKWPIRFFHHPSCRVGAMVSFLEGKTSPIYRSITSATVRFRDSTVLMYPPSLSSVSVLFAQILASVRRVKLKDWGDSQRYEFWPGRRYRPSSGV